MSPYGVERLAQCFPEALHLAHLCRRRCRNHTTRELVEEEGAIRAVYGAAMCMAASHAARKLPAPPASSTTRVGRIELLGECPVQVIATDQFDHITQVFVTPSHELQLNQTGERNGAQVSVYFRF